MELAMTPEELRKEVLTKADLSGQTKLTYLAILDHQKHGWARVTYKELATALGRAAPTEVMRMVAHLWDKNLIEVVRTSMGSPSDRINSYRFKELPAAYVWSFRTDEFIAEGLGELPEGFEFAWDGDSLATVETEEPDQIQVILYGPQDADLKEAGDFLAQHYSPQELEFKALTRYQPD
jgi:hypothetical protein